MHINGYFWGSGHNFDIVIRFSDPDFLQDSNNLAIKCFQGFFHCTYKKSATLLFPAYLTTDLMTMNVCQRLHSALG